MARINKGGPDKVGSMTLDRANQYQAAARERFPEPGRALAGLATLQRDYINHTSSGELKSPIHMNLDELSEAMTKSQHCKFGNCD